MERDPVAELLPVRTTLEHEEEGWERVSRPGSAASLTWVSLGGGPGTPARCDSPWVATGVGTPADPNPLGLGQAWDYAASDASGVQCLPTASLSPSPRPAHQDPHNLGTLDETDQPESDLEEERQAQQQDAVPDVDVRAGSPVQEDSFQSTSAASEAHQPLAASTEGLEVSTPKATLATTATTQVGVQEVQQGEAAASPPASPSHKRRPSFWRLVISVPLLSVVFSTLLCVVATTLMAQRSSSRSKATTCSAAAAKAGPAMTCPASPSASQEVSAA